MIRSKALLIGLAVWLAACSSSSGQPAAAPAAAPGANAGRSRTMPTPLPTRAVSVSTSVSVDGVLALSVPAIGLGFDVSGKVVAVNAVPGQAVKKGDVLATIDDTTQQDAVADAQLALEVVEASIRQQYAATSEEELAAAQAALNAAYAGYNETKSGTSQSELDRAASSSEAAWLQYLSSKASRDIACGNDTASSRCQSAEASLGNAYESMLSARDSYQELLEPVSKNVLAQAYTSVASAKAKLEALKAGATEEQRAVNEMQIAQANAALERAREELSKTQLVSPCDCVVQAVNAVPGVAAPATAFTLVDLSGIRFTTTNLTERDVAAIQLGAAVTIRLTPYSELFTGQVVAVLAQSSGTQSGAALYTALIDLDPTTVLLLPGMTGQAEIATQ